MQITGRSSFFADSCRMRNGKPMSVLVTTCAGAVSESFSLPRRDVMGFPALHKEKLLMIRSRQNTLAGRHACLLNCNWLKGFKIINSPIRYTVILPGNNNCASVGVFLLRAFPLEKAAALKWRLFGWRNPGGVGVGTVIYIYSLPRHLGGCYPGGLCGSSLKHTHLFSQLWVSTDTGWLWYSHIKVVSHVLFDC